MKNLKPLRMVVWMLLALCWVLHAQAEQPHYIARKLIALYDSASQDNIRLLNIHRLFEMPANRLGFDVYYYDIHKPLPELGNDVQGLIIGFDAQPKFKNDAYIDWLHKAIKAGKRVAFVGETGFGNIDALTDERVQKLRYIQSRVGVRDEGIWVPLTHKSKVLLKDEELLDFERKLTAPLPPFAQTQAAKDGTSHLRVAMDAAEPGAFADLVITGPQGGYIAPGYAFHEQDLQDRYVTAWYINPFAFLRKTLVDEPFPVPDVTTRLGRRIFYSHIDGDGWNNLSLIEEYQETLTSPIEVLHDKIIKAYPQFGFSVGVVAGDVANDCFGSEKSRAAAKRVLALSNVEAASHTYTHPLYWQFFEHYTTEKEARFVNAYPKKAGMFAQDFSSLLAMKHKHKKRDEGDGRKPEKRIADMSVDERVLELYDTPRSYNCVPFDADKEITGAKEVVEALAPKGKTVKLLQWSGNTSPYEGFIRKVREAGMLNINGGESRFDNEYPSYSSLYPIGVHVGDELQIYSSASNENTYTNLWSERYFGYRYLIETVHHTEEPIRVSPFNVYFHSYSGERPASLRALVEIMDYASQRELIPLYTSTFAEIANGFFTTQIEKLGEHHWQVHNRGRLDTLRFDGAEALRVDFARSKGVLGERLYQGNLYIFINPSFDNPEIMLTNASRSATPVGMHVISSRWDVVSAKLEAKTRVTYKAQGFGPGEMRWKVPVEGKYSILVTTQSGEQQMLHSTANHHEIAFELSPSVTPVDVVISHVEAAE